MKKIPPMIMCGGSGSRVWPESRESVRKQFTPLVGDRSSFQSIVSLLSDRTIFEPPVVITNFDYRFHVAEQLKDIGVEATICSSPIGVIGRPRSERRPPGRRAIRRPSSPCLPLTMSSGMERISLSTAGGPGAAVASGEIVTFGLVPDHPGTGYGHIQPTEPLAVDPQVQRIERFVEKPDEARARAFIDEGYLWNSGNFVFLADVRLDEFARFEPEIASATREAVAMAHADLRHAFIKSPKISIDYAMMDRNEKAAVLAADEG